MDSLASHGSKTGAAASSRSLGARRRPTTGPLPQVPWRDLEPVVTLEQRLPRLLVVLFGAVLAIQLVLHL